MNETMGSQVGREDDSLHGSGPWKASGASSITCFNFLSFSSLCFHGDKHPTSLRSISSLRALAGLQKIMDVAEGHQKLHI
jgi:hypothetical protein